MAGKRGILSVVTTRPRSNLKEESLFLLSALGWGTSVFLFVTGGRILDPAYVSWLLHGDPVQHYIGWKFFRSAPFPRFPLGDNPSLGLGLSSSIVFTDSLPLLAIPFRSISSWLPRTFQYTGLWIFSSLILQAWLGLRILLLGTRRRLFAVVGSGFFVIAPVLLWRLRGHYALFGQWLVLWGLYLYFGKRHRAGMWSAVLLVAALVHFYLLVMCMSILVADLLKRVLGGDRGWKTAGLEMGGQCILVLAAMIAVGYFEGIGGESAGGFGYYRLNLLAIVDSDGLWSRVLPDIGGAGGDYEGFCFLGLGVLLLLPIACVAVWRRRRAIFPDRASTVPLVVMSTGLTLFAVSNHVGVGEYELGTYWIPYRALQILGLLRASGRLFWPVVYLVMVAVLVLVARGLDRRIATSACVIALSLQLVDSGAAFAMFRQMLSNASKPRSPLQSAVWDAAASHREKLLYVPPGNRTSNYAALALFASDHSLAINTGYFSRLDSARVDRARDDMIGALLAGRLDRSAIYVFHDSRGLWSLALGSSRPGDFTGFVDGFPVLVPGWRPAWAAGSRSFPMASVQSGDWLRLGRGSAGAKDLAYGWEPLEGPRARCEALSCGVVVGIERSVAKFWSLEMEISAPPRGETWAHDLQVLVDQKPVGSFEIPVAGLRDRVIERRFQGDFLVASNPRAVVELVGGAVEDSRFPVPYRQRRPLGVTVRRLRLRPETDRR